MYKLTYVSDNGNTFVFGENNVFEADNLNNTPIDLGTEQGFNQVGETVKTQTVEGKKITIDGQFFPSHRTTQKTKMAAAFTAFSSGELQFGDAHYMRVFVKETPTIGVDKKDCSFILSLFAPIPFWATLPEESVTIGGIVPAHRFPINYGTPHRFGNRSAALYQNVYNDGVIQTPLLVYFYASGDVENITVTNLATGAEMAFPDAVLAAGDLLTVTRNEQMQLSVTLTEADGTVTDKFEWLDEDGTLEYLAVGDNYIKSAAETGGTLLRTVVRYEVYAGAVFDV